MKIPHWLKHTWSNWTQYEREYGPMSCRPENTIYGVYRVAVREWRRCEICNSYQDREVSYDGGLPKEASEENRESSQKLSAENSR
jgi:hypothetical protein